MSSRKRKNEGLEAAGTSKGNQKRRNLPKFRNPPAASQAQPAPSAEIITMQPANDGFRTRKAHVPIADVIMEPTQQASASGSNNPIINNTHDWQDAVNEEPAGTSSAPPLEKPKKPRKSRKNKIHLADWAKHYWDHFLDETIRHEGPIHSSALEICSDCEKDVPNGHVYRCLDCFTGMRLHCLACTVKNHGANPFHRIQRWTGNHFAHEELHELGLNVQLGHDGNSCPSPSEPTNLLVLHTAGAFTLSVMYCGCKTKAADSKYLQLLRSRLYPTSLKRIKTAFTFDLLDHFQELNLQAKTTAYDYYNNLLRQTDFLKLGKQPSQLNNFNRVMREWRHLKQLRRAARGHHPSGASGTSPGELLPECLACPHPGKNLPPNWEDADVKAFLYTLFVSVDANFKLKGKNRGLNDIELGPGWAVFVAEDGYQVYIGNYEDQPEINTCDSEHDAIVRAAVRCTPGYSITGAGLVICSRHCLIRCNGAGDLQKGERYCNMDYIVFSAISGTTVQHIVVTYDIACQWSRNLFTRMKGLPGRLQLSEDISIEVAIPSWHINGHGTPCQQDFHVGHLVGVGRLCGDEVEQTWWNTNSLGASVQEMGPAGRHEVLNDHWSAFNMKKIIGFRSRFAKNFKTAVHMQEKQAQQHEQFTGSFPTALADQWEAVAIAWEADHSQPNPYEEEEITTTLQDVCLALAQEEVEEMQSGGPILHTKSMLAFLTAGLDLEEQQYVLHVEIDSEPTTNTKADLMEKQATLLRRISAWREVQLAYTPVVRSLLATSAESSSSDTSLAIAAEDVPLFLPSSLSLSQRQTVNRAANMEMRLREAQAGDAITEICRVLHVYRAARSALLALEPNGSWTSRFHVLNEETDFRKPEREKGESLGRHTLSWIWGVSRNQASRAALERGSSRQQDTDANPPDSVLDDMLTEEQLNQSLRAEWAQSRARAMCWREEVDLLEEEMRRVVAYLRWQARWWKDQADLRQDCDGSIKLGLRGYTHKQSANVSALADSCLATWLACYAKLGRGNGNVPTAKSKKGKQRVPVGQSNNSDLSDDDSSQESDRGSEKEFSGSDLDEGGAWAVEEMGLMSSYSFDFDL
ncbi:hypothetical protein BKA70DRAFT_1373432 [Coprinopsis sp. MPI-PUGE-AT-0042]|nr:hypothetical protein BKA70DRAFT_1373432 [Coprinopsis sp. MPI-PUGE-AT-0042]